MWQDRAACRAHPHPEWWWPEKGHTANRAKRICLTCQVRQQCLDWAIATGEQGIWGGTSDDRKELRRQQRKGA